MNKNKYPSFLLEERMKLTPKEIANFLQISYKTFCDKKEKKLKELELFADYHLEPKDKKTTYIVIDKVIEPAYSKQPSESYRIIAEEFEKAWNTVTDECGNTLRLDTAAHVAQKIAEARPLTTTESTNAKYVNEIRKERYGTPYVRADIFSKQLKGYSKNAFPGSLGYCYKMICKKNQKTGEIFPLTHQEEVKKKELLKLYYADADERTVLVQSMIKTGELKSSEAWDYYESAAPNCYYDFLQKLGSYCGAPYVIICGTVLEDGSIKEDPFK